MEIEYTDIEGVVVLRPRVFRDERGYFFESYSQREFERLVGPVHWVQDNESCSSRGVVRGLHYQKGEHAQAKLVRCVEGRVLDVAVDVRRGSPTFGRHVAVELTAEGHEMLYIPRGFAHGFAVLSERAVFQYKCDNYYAPSSEGGVQAFDPALGIDWRVAADEAILSAKDRVRGCLDEATADFDYADFPTLPRRRNILVTGADGQLGRSIRRLADPSIGNFIFTDVKELDITDRAAVDAFVDDRNVDLIINCAAYTNVDAAESDEERARVLNALAPSYLAEAMQRRGGWMVHVSTDYVFGMGGSLPFTEEQGVDPLGAYGRTKFEGEELVRRACPERHVIVRTAWLYSEYGRNFVKTMLDLTGRLERVKVVFDQVGSPTYAPDLAKAILTVISSPKLTDNPGTYHFSDEGVCSWYDLARRVAFIAGHEGCSVEPCHSSEFPSPVTRPPYSVLDKTKIKETFGVTVPYWTDSLDLCLLNLNS